MKDSLRRALVVDGIVQDAVLGQSVRIDFAVVEFRGTLRKGQLAGQAVPIGRQRLRRQLGNLVVARRAQDVVQKGLNALVNGRQVIVQQPALLAVDAKEVRGHVQKFVFIRRRFVFKALRRQLDRNDALQDGGIHHRGLPAVFVEAHVATEVGFLGGGDDHDLIDFKLLVVSVVVPLDEELFFVGCLIDYKENWNAFRWLCCSD